MAYEFEHSFKKMRYSVTDASCVGDAALHKAQVVSPANVFKLEAKVVPAVLHYLREAWPTCSNEDAVQVIFCKSVNFKNKI